MKKLFLLLLLAGSLNLFPQAPSHTPNWHLGAAGIDLEKALTNNPKPEKAKQVIVAIIDNGTDIKHPDLAGQIWVNEKEIPGNAVDDDHNGYIDDINGWDYLGNLGGDIAFDNLEKTRLLRDYRKRFGDKTSKEIAKSDRADYKKYKELEKDFDKELAKSKQILSNIEQVKKYSDALLAEIDSPNISLAALEAFEPKASEAKIGKAIVTSQCANGVATPKQVFDEISEAYKHFYTEVNYQLNLDFDPRPRIGDNYLDPKDINYGNNEVRGPDAEHGTHVAGTVGALRENALPAKGIVPMVKLMILRVVPDGDERDKDVANAIRYAADNGAKVINMSFGKGYSFNKKIVDDAVKYAESKDVLLVHGAGNDGQNNDKSGNFPNPRYEDGTVCKTWIEVGASDQDQTPASFSNYGKKSVNVFAPGVQIYNTFPDGKYKSIDGTSMASPVVAGLAGLIRSYYPNLTAVQVKQVIESSVYKPTEKVKRPGSRKKKTKYRKISTSAGIVNADKALKAAAAMK